MATIVAAASTEADQENAHIPNGDHRKKNQAKGQGGKQGRSGGGKGKSSAGDAERATSADSAETDLLEPPTPVAEPNVEENNARLESLRAEINSIEARVSEINAEVQAAKEVRGLQEEAVKDIRSQMAPLRTQIVQLYKDKDELVDRLKKLSETIRNEEVAINKIRKDLRFKTEEEIDRAIAEANYRLETSSIDLKTEKDIVRNLQRLNSDREELKKLNQKIEDVKAKKFTHEDLFLQRQAKSAELKQLQDQEKLVQAKIDSVRNGEGVENGFNVNAKITALLDEKARLVEKLKEKRANMQEVNVAFRLKMGEYRDYKKAKIAYERKLENIEKQKRQAEAAARSERIKEERKQRDLERKEAKRREEQRMIAVAEGCQLYVGGLAIRCEEAAIRAHFERFGTMTDVTVIRDAETKLSRGFGFVVFAEEARAREAIKECNGKEAKGLCPQHGKMQVKMAEKSRAQQEFEAKRAASAAARARKAAGGINGNATDGGAAAGGVQDDETVGGENDDDGGRDVDGGDQEADGEGNDVVDAGHHVGGGAQGSGKAAATTEAVEAEDV